MSRILASGSLILLLSVAIGCQRAAAPKFTPSAAVTALSPDLREAVQAVLTSVVGTPRAPRPFGQESNRAAKDHLRFGAEVYELQCAACHGVTGDGAGPAAKYLQPHPRDYRRGMFKFTSTPYGSKPRRTDLIRTVKRGVQGTSMPSFALLTGAEIEAVVDYVLLLTHRGELETLLAFDADSQDEIDPEVVDEYAAEILDPWNAAEDQIVMPVTAMPEVTDETVELGRVTFLARECFKCHGQDGRGGSLGGVEVGNDSWGFPNPAADLTSGMLHGGQRPVDIYRRIYSGINGTQMPEFKQVFAEDPDTLWHLVHYMMHLADQRRRGEWFLSGDDGGQPAATVRPAADDETARTRRAAREGLRPEAGNERR